MAGNFPMNVYNNMIVNNVSTHEGGGIGINDAPNVRVLQQHDHEEPHHGHRGHQQRHAGPGRVVDLGQQRPAAGHAAWRVARLQQPAAVQQHLLGQPGRHPRGRLTVTGIGLAGDATRSTTGTWASPTAPGCWRRPTRSSSRTLACTRIRRVRPTARPTRTSSRTYDVSVAFAPWRQNPRFRGCHAGDDRSTAQPDGRLSPDGCRARRRATPGAASRAVPTYQQPAAPTPYQATGTTTLNSPTTDYDNQGRPAAGGFDIGADEVGSGGTARPVDHQDRRPDQHHCRRQCQLHDRGKQRRSWHGLWGDGHRQLPSCADGEQLDLHGDGRLDLHGDGHRQQPDRRR